MTKDGCLSLQTTPQTENYSISMCKEYWVGVLRHQCNPTTYIRHKVVLQNGQLGQLEPLGQK